MPNTPYLGPQYRPRMFAPPPVGVPSLMAPPQFGHDPAMYGVPNGYGGVGGTPGTIAGGGSGGTNEPTVVDPGPTGYAGEEPDMSSPSDDYTPPQLSDSMPELYDAFSSWDAVYGGPDGEGGYLPDSNVTWHRNLDVGKAGNGGMLDRVKNMIGGASRLGNYTPSGMLATMGGAIPAVAGAAPFQSTPTMTSDSWSTGWSAPSAQPQGGMNAGYAPGSVQQSALPQMSEQDLSAALTQMGNDPRGMLGDDWREDQVGSFNQDNYAEYDGEGWFYDPVTETWYR